MCRRLRLPDDLDAIAAQLQIRCDVRCEPERRYNVSPPLLVNVITYDRERKGRALKPMRWGQTRQKALPFEFGNPQSSVRVETIKRTGRFAEIWNPRFRCIIPVKLFYAWRKGDGPGRNPAFAVAMKDHQTMLLAGTWRPRGAKESAEVDSFVVLTTSASPAVAPVQERMPLILSIDNLSKWLGEADAAKNEISDLMVPLPSEQLAIWEVDPRVAESKREEERLDRPIDHGEPWTSRF